MADPVTLTFSVSGMHCASCGMLIDEVVEDLPGVERSETDSSKGRTVVRADGPVSATDIVAAIAEAGYQATPEDG